MKNENTPTNVPTKPPSSTSRLQQLSSHKVPSRGKRKASSMPPRPPSVSICTCNTTLSAPFQETCSLCKENSAPSEGDLNNGETRSLMSTSTDDDSETGMQQMQRKVVELFREKENMEAKMKLKCELLERENREIKENMEAKMKSKCELLERENRELKEKLRKVVGVVAEGESFLKKLKRYCCHDLICELSISLLHCLSITPPPPSPRS
jgi:hypothetical protein